MDPRDTTKQLVAARPRMWSRSIWFGVTLLASAALATATAAAAPEAATPEKTTSTARPAGAAKPAKAPGKGARAATGAAGAGGTAAADKEPAAATSAPAGGDKAAAAAAPAGSSPMAELKKSNLALDKVLQKNRPNWSPEAELQRAEVRKIVGSFLDYGELAHRALARHWEPLTPKQREEFVNTLRELVERSYLRQVHGNASYNIKYEKEEKTGNEAAVTAAINTMARGKKVIIALEYRMLYKEGHWVVYDVLTDDQSMLENYRAEFNKIITKESFDALLKKMKKKLEDKDEEKD
jgi:phospholipid transport system substrate-binding protein